ncbi:MAG: DUF2652 domain-containing protein [Dehalococcoidia bacterium]
MQPRENQLVIILADISGYTRFMVENQLSAVHGQICITTLIEALLREVDIPLRLQEVEGDAVFLYAEHPGDDSAWQDVLAQVRTKLVRFFEVFLEGMLTAAESTPCKCAICSNAHELSPKIVVHYGQAVFHTIAGRPQVSGADVILAHRLLKNSIASNQYLLMSEAAYGELGVEMGLAFAEGEERYGEFGSVKTRVHGMQEAVEDIRDSLYSLDRDALSLRARKYVLWASLSQIPAAVAQLRSPAIEIGWFRRLLFVLWVALSAPAAAAIGLITIPRKLVAKRSARSVAHDSQAAT